MKKLLAGLLAGFMLAGCGSATAQDITSSEVLPEEAKEAIEEAAQVVEEAVSSIDTEELTKTLEVLKGVGELKILAPSGAPALSLLPAQIAGLSIDFVDGADPLQAALVNPTPEYDIIVAPSNLGMKLAAAGKSTYKMLGVVTWGNLYIVAEKGTEADPSTWTNVASFGEQSVTGKVFTEAYGADLNMDEVTWYNSTAEASAALISGEAKVAMLAEPNATASIAKAKENGIELEIIDDVQARYSGETGKGFPQAALFVQADSYAEHKDEIDTVFSILSEFSSAVNEMDADSLAELIESAGGAETFGIPNSQIAAKVWDRLNINVAAASDHIEELSEFGKLFEIEDITAALLN